MGNVISYIYMYNCTFATKKRILHFALSFVITNLAKNIIHNN